jgi:hypothetical protein
MIINGGAAGNTGWWGNHLTSEKNDRAELVEARGLLAEDVPTALREMEAIAAGSRSRGNFMYQANINPRDDEVLTPEQWAEAVDALEKNLGLEGHQRVVVEHEKEGRIHQHVMWNRVDVDTLRVADIGGNYYTHEHTARELEARFNLAHTPSLHGEQRPEGRPDRAPELWEYRAAERSGIGRDELKAELTEIYRTTDSGKTFRAAVEERGYVMAEGDRRTFVVVDHAGDVHSLARRIEGVKVNDLRERFSDIDRESLPNVEEARAIQREHYPTAEAVREAWDGKAQATSPNQVENAVSDVLEGAADLGASIGGVTQGAAKGAFMVAEALANAALKLFDFVEGMFGGGAPPPPPESQVEQLRAQRRALAALERISESIKNEQPIAAGDIRSLTSAHLQGIREGGDEYLKILLDRMETDRKREQEREDWGRARER